MGRPNKNHRLIINGILWVLRTGAPWPDVPPKYGKWRTVASLFYRWSASGIWQQVLEALQAQCDAVGQFDWQVHFVDGSLSCAHQHAAGAKGGTLKPRRSGAAVADSPPSCICAQKDEVGPFTSVLTLGQRNEATVFTSLMSQGSVRRKGRGSPCLGPDGLAADKGYSSRAIRNYLRLRHIRCIIPRRKDECRRGRFDRDTYRLRNKVERLIDRLKQFRRVATRYEKRAANYLAMVTIASILLWLSLQNPPSLLLSN